MQAAAIRIIGIDPGLRNMGWGIVELAGSRLIYVASGTVRSNDKAPLAGRLRTLHEGLAEIVASYRPDEAAIEEVFVNKDPQSTLKLGQARGIALVVPALAGLPVVEYAANLVKKTVVGTGHAEKTQDRDDGQSAVAEMADGRAAEARGRCRRCARGCDYPCALSRTPRECSNEACGDARAKKLGQGLRLFRQSHTLERFPIGWTHPIEKKTLKINRLEHVLIGKVRNFSGTCSRA